LRAAVLRAKPDVVVHQLTDLPPALDPARMAEARGRNAHIREEGTRNLIAAALAAGARRLVAQSVAFAYAAGPLPYREEDPIDVGTPDKPNVSGQGVVSLERQVLAAPLEGLVLRYGSFYGPDTGFAAPTRPGPLHVEDAAEAARLAVRRGPPGIYNVAEDDGTVAIYKAQRLLGWRPAHRAC
jgi:nucleoside-diphosphate-sugar epimerase